MKSDLLRLYLSGGLSDFDLYIYVLKIIYNNNCKIINTPFVV